jgi:hypothetical protein
MRKVDGLKEPTWRSYLMLAFNVAIVAIGFFFLGAGTYTSIQSIIDSYAAGTVSGVFTCASNGL